MRDEQTNAREPMTCTWVAVTGSDGRTHMEARWLSASTTVATPAAPATPATLAAAHAA